MTFTPLVTVYLPTHNRREMLERAVESVLNQTYAQLELIVIDDGSTDDTAAWLDQRAQQDNRIVPLYHATAMGAPRSRNEAILQGRGEFITGLDDDDYFHPQRLERLVERWRQLEARQQPFSCLFTQDMYIGDGADRISRKPARVDCNDLYFYNTIGNQIFTRRQWFIDAGLFDEAMPCWQDLDAFIRVLRLHGPAVLLDQPLQCLNLDPRPDRISLGSKERFFTAYRRLSSKPHASPVLRQGLLLQVFGNNVRPTAATLVEFFGYGLHLRTLRTLLRVLARSAVSVSRFS